MKDWYVVISKVTELRALCGATQISGCGNRLKWESLVNIWEKKTIWVKFINEKKSSQKLRRWKRSEGKTVLLH